MKRITREELLDEIESGAEVVRKPAFTPPSPMPAPAVDPREIEKMLEGYKAAMVDAIAKGLAKSATPKKFRISTYRDGNDDLQGEITVVE